MVKRQTKHVRRSKKGKKFMAGSKKKVMKRRRMEPACEITTRVRREIVSEEIASIIKDLKKTGRVRIKDLGILKIKVKPARKARMGINPFTREKMMFKAKPRSKVVKFSVAKSLKEKI